jgi:hypothetical protein
MNARRSASRTLNRLRTMERAQWTANRLEGREAPMMNRPSVAVCLLALTPLPGSAGSPSETPLTMVYLRAAGAEPRNCFVNRAKRSPNTRPSSRSFSLTPGSAGPVVACGPSVPNVSASTPPMMMNRISSCAWAPSGADNASYRLDDVGLGVLFGLTEWRFAVLALMQHAAHLDKRFRCGPHTLSIPRIEPAEGSDISEHPPHAVSDEDFKKLIAILRLAVFC